jgi:L-threonylcarbamoyladenylate synthase
MKTVTMDASDLSVIQSAREVILSGGLIAYPTDTVYGLSASPFHAAAIEKIFSAKGRGFNKAVAILVGDMEQLPLVTTGFTESAKVLAKKFWPGALTLVVPIAPGLPGVISPYGTIGIRMPDHPFALTLLHALGPLATTSANISGQPDAINAAQVLEQLAGRVDLILDGGASPGGVPSTVVDCCQPQIRILRQGAISLIEIENALDSAASNSN